MKPQESDNLPTDNTALIARQVESGEYFRLSREMYAFSYLDPMSDRYFFMLTSAVSGLILAFMLLAFYLFMPLSVPVPFTYMSTNVIEELPRIRMIGKHLEPPNEVLRRFLISNYVIMRESYDINALDFSVRAIKNQSTPEVFSAWEKFLDPSNPDSPITQFQRHSRRTIKIVQVTRKDENSVDVVFDALVQGGIIKSSRQYATVAFKFTDVTIDQDSGKTTPLDFIVTDYRTRRLQD